MLRVVPPERLCWSKDSKATNRTSDKENGLKRNDRSAPLASGGMSGRLLVGPTSEQSSVDNLRGNRAPKAQSERPLKAMQAVQSQSERKDAAAADTPNPKHKRRVSLKDLCPADKQRVRQLVEELARVTAEKERLEGRLAKERRRFERTLRQMQQEQQRTMEERARLEQSLQDTQLQLQLASSRPYHEESSHSLPTTVGHPQHWLAGTGAALAKTSSLYNSMQSGCPHDVPSSSEECIQMKGFKPAPLQHSAARFELYPNNQSESSDLSLLRARQEGGSSKKGLPPTPLPPPTHPPSPQTRDVGTGTVSPDVPRTGTPPLVSQVATSCVSVTTQTSCSVGTQTVSPRGEGTNQPDLATCLMPQPCSSSQPAYSAVPATLAQPPMGQRDSNYSRTSQLEEGPSQHMFSVNQPTLLPTAVNQPSALHTAVNQPSSLHTAVNQPSALHTAVNQPSSLHIAVNQPYSLHTAVNQPTSLHTAVNQPTSLHTAVNQPSSLHTAVNQPTSLHTAVHQPSSLHTAVHQPTSLHTAVNQPTSLHTAVHQPSSLQVEENQQWGAMLATALQTAQSTLGTHELVEQPNMEALNKSPLPNLGPVWEADLIEALNNTSLHTVASWAGGPHGISTPVTRRREDRDSHKSFYGTDAVQDKDLLEELFFLH